MDVVTLATVVGSATAVVSAVTAGAIYVAKPLRRVVQQNDEFREDWYGQPARAGVLPRPGVMERLATIEAQLNDHLLTHRQVP